VKEHGVIVILVGVPAVLIGSLLYRSIKRKKAEMDFQFEKGSMWEDAGIGVHNMSMMMMDTTIAMQNTKMGSQRFYQQARTRSGWKRLLL
jgi:hypothetical protein